MHDPRIERVARVLSELDDFQPSNPASEAALKEARRYVAVHDALNPRPAPSTKHLRRAPAITVSFAGSDPES